MILQDARLGRRCRHGRYFFLSSYMTSIFISSIVPYWKGEKSIKFNYIPFFCLPFPNAIFLTYIVLNNFFTFTCCWCLVFSDTLTDFRWLFSESFTLPHFRKKLLCYPWIGTEKTSRNTIVTKINFSILNAKNKKKKVFRDFQLIYVGV